MYYSMVSKYDNNSIPLSIRYVYNLDDYYKVYVYVAIEVPRNYEHLSSNIYFSVNSKQMLPYGKIHVLSYDELAHPVDVKIYYKTPNGLKLVVSHIFPYEKTNQMINTTINP